MLNDPESKFLLVNNYMRRKKKRMTILIISHKIDLKIIIKDFNWNKI